MNCSAGVADTKRLCCGRQVHGSVFFRRWELVAIFRFKQNLWRDSIRSSYSVILAVNLKFTQSHSVSENSQRLHHPGEEQTHMAPPLAGSCARHWQRLG